MQLSLDVLQQKMGVFYICSRYAEHADGADAFVMHVLVQQAGHTVNYHNNQLMLTMLLFNTVLGLPFHPKNSRLKRRAVQS